MGKIFTVFFVFFTFSINAQLCTGSLGDPVVKVDFGSGTSTRGGALGTSFTSYTYSASGFPSDGYYTVTNTTSGMLNSWWSTYDHDYQVTGLTTGYMMVVNANLSVTDYFYKNTVTGLCPGTTYEFAAWILNLFNNGNTVYPNLTFTITDATSGTLLGSYSTGDITGSTTKIDWKQYGFYFVASTSSVILKITNNKAGAAPGNDLALDDITFRPCGPSVSASISGSSTTSVSLCENQSLNYTLLGTTSLTSGLDYQWQISTDNGTTWTDIVGANSINYTILGTYAAGIYKFRLATAKTGSISSSSCRIVSNEIIVTVNAAPNAAVATITQPTCTNITGSFVVTSPTGTDYTYSIDGTNYQSSTTFSNLSAGTYSVFVKSSTGCISTASSVTINSQPATPSAPTVTTVNPICASGTGSITVTSPLDSTYKYSIDGTNYQSSPIFSDLSSGTYSVTLKTSDGCISSATSATITAQNPVPPAPVLSIIQPFCTGNTGTITVTSPLDSTYTYSLNGISYQSSPIFLNVSDGTYSVMVKNSTGCISTVTSATIVVQYTIPSTPILSISQPVCTGDTGIITITSPIDTTYSYSIDGTNYQSSTTFSNLATGNYSVMVKNAGGCVSTAASATISPQNTTPLAPVLSITQPVCSGDTGTISISSPVGSDCSYSIDGVNYQSGTTFSGLSDGSYSVTVKISAGCTSPDTNATIATQNSNPSSPTISITQPANCADTGSITVISTGYQYSFDNGSTWVSSNSISGLSVGTYYVKIRTQSLCESPAIEAIIVATDDYPVLNITSPQQFCPNSTVTLDAGSGFASYTWYFNGTHLTAYDDLQTIEVGTAGTYTITVTNSLGCVASADFVVTAFEVPTDFAVTVDEKTAVISVSPSGNYLYSLDNVNWQTSNVFKNLENKTYTAYIKTATGCFAGSLVFSIFVIPNVITPNENGYNDKWKIGGLELYPGSKVEVFDRYYKKLLDKTVDGIFEWDGKYLGRVLPTSTYWYVIHVTDGRVLTGFLFIKERD